MTEEEKVQLCNDYPLLTRMMDYEEIVWHNDRARPVRPVAFSMDETYEAEQRLKRFAPYLQAVFPQLIETNGVIESQLVEIPAFAAQIDGFHGRLYVKCDHELPISGSIKARGGIYEVLKFAEHVAMKHGLLREDDHYATLTSSTCRDIFSQYTIAVGSTGNLGLSIGLIGATLGFSVNVHMSADAKAWKKQLLRARGVTVIEYESDYSAAVANGRAQAASDPYCHFVDDENSIDLFAGYSVAALRLQQQLAAQQIDVSAEQPLYVYIPCGVGGGPGGVAFGLKQLFGEHVHIYFAEPTHAPCMTIGMMTGLHDAISVQDFGIDGKTEADGLAVGRASGFVGQMMESMLAGCYTVDDAFLFESMRQLEALEHMFLEPSAHAAVKGAYIMKEKQGTHIIWATGGSMVPEEERELYRKK